jgi:transcriptional regulator with XRE-family HTH domain
MEELGHILREAREARGYTLAQAQAKTRINLKFLEALENGEYAVLPTIVHARGYLRNYARFLNLDPQPLLERFETVKSRQPGAAVSRPVNNSSLLPSDPLPLRDDQPFFVPANLELSGAPAQESGSALRWIIIIALLLAIFLVANRFIPLLTNGQDGTQALTEGGMGFLSGLLGGDEEPEEGQDELTFTAPIEPDGGRDIINTGAPTNPPISQPTQATLPATLETIQLRLEITERAWMRVTIDGQVVFEGLARRGEGPFEWEARQEARFLTGNGAGVYVTINGIELGRLGERGAVVDEVWSTAGN